MAARDNRATRKLRRRGGLRQKASATVINFNGIVARARVPRRGTERTQESGHERMRGMMAPRARIFIFIFRLSLARARGELRRAGAHVRRTCRRAILRWRTRVMS